MEVWCKWHTFCMAPYLIYFLSFFCHIVLYCFILLVLRHSARNSEIKKKNLWWCPQEHLDKYKNVACSKYYFQNKNSKYEILNHLYSFIFWSKFRLFWDCFKAFYPVLLFNFSLSTNHGDRHFYSAPLPPPTIKKLPMALG